MKGIKAISILQKNVLPDYERQRLEKLKRNAEFMAAQGRGSLATQIYDKSKAFANNIVAMNTWDDNQGLSNEDGDDEYMPENEGSEDEFGYGNVKSNTKVYREKSGPMAAFIKHKTEQQPSENHHVKQLPERQPPELQLSEEQCTERQQRSLPFEKNMQNPVDQNAVKPMSRVQQRSQQHRNNQPEKQSLRLQKKQQQKAYCRPGSLSAFRELRKKQSGYVIPDYEVENPSNHEVAYACEVTSTTTNGQGLEIEPQLKDAENVVMDGRTGALHENESQQRIEIPIEEEATTKGILSSRVTVSIP
ncbi:hypothetical protein SOVF_194970, partial [Spinacia oleracea]